ncbi:MAG: peptidoglycan DD-metalloendopeptidase family protein [Parcubacteria group bacterium]
MNNRSIAIKFKAIKMLIAGVCVFILPLAAGAETSAEITELLNGKKQEIEQLKKQIEVYQQNIDVKKREAATLKNQLSILQSQIAKSELDLRETAARIAAVQLEIKDMQMQISSKEKDIGQRQISLAATLQDIYKNDHDNSLKIFILNNSLSDYFSQLEYSKELQNKLAQSLVDLKGEKKSLQSKQRDLEIKNSELLSLKNNLTLQKEELSGQKTYKNNLLAQTQNSEKKYSALYQKALAEQNAISSEIANLEKKARARLSESQRPALLGGQLTWPVPVNAITTYFHDPEYPFRYIFEHPAIDIRAKQGSPIAAPLEGYVLNVKNGGMGYSYIAILHASGLSTVYGHVSKIFVQTDEYVSRGEIIGLTGGMPGTPGAGPLTTGPHLHFEVRANGIPVNPLDYLP